MAHGGKRRNSGRKKGKAGERTVIAQCTAAGILTKIGEAETWDWIITTAKRKQDAKTVADVMKYLTDRRDGKPRQAIEATGPNGGPMAIQIVSGIPRPIRGDTA